VATKFWTPKEAKAKKAKAAKKGIHFFNIV
jgi:hypothetical protein